MNYLILVNKKEQYDHVSELTGFCLEWGHFKYEIARGRRPYIRWRVDSIIVRWGSNLASCLAPRAIERVGKITVVCYNEFLRLYNEHNNRNEVPR